MRSLLATLALTLALGSGGVALAQEAEGAQDVAGAAETHEQHGADEAHHGPPPVNFFDFGYGDKNVEGGELGEDDVPMPPPLILMLVNFGIFAGILVWKAGPALRRYFDDKHETIQTALTEASRLREEASQKLEEYGQRIKDVDDEVNQLIAKLKADAEAERERILAEAERQAEQTKRSAEERIEAEIAAARRELEREVVVAATLAAEKLIREKASPSDQTAMVESFLSGLGGSNKPAKAPEAPSSTDEGWS